MDENVLLATSIGLVLRQTHSIPYAGFSYKAGSNTCFRRFGHGPCA